MRTAAGALLTALLVTALAPAAVEAQHSFGTQAHFLGYDFDEGLGADAAQLLILPVAYRVPIQERFLLDFYTAWAEGQVEQNGATLSLDGFVDTQVKVSWRATPWAVVSLAANIPTGNESHTDEEAVVAAVLSSDLFGFREATWGTGFSLTSGIATATRFNEWGVGIGASYRLANEFEPVADSSFGYEPGDEVRIRLGLDRNIGETGKLNAGFTFQNFSEDEANGENLFQAGNRILADLAYAFRLGNQTWTLYAADIWREEGDLSLDVVNEQTGAVVGDTVITTGSQNLVIAGVTGGIPLSGPYRLQPALDIRHVSRDSPGADTDEDTGSGYIAGVGLEFPLRLYGTVDVTPRARFVFGSITDAEGEGQGVTGGELSLRLRWIL